MLYSFKIDPLIHSQFTNSFKSFFSYTLHLHTVATVGKQASVQLEYKKNCWFYFSKKFQLRCFQFCVDASKLLSAVNSFRFFRIVEYCWIFDIRRRKVIIYGRLFSNFPFVSFYLNFLLILFHLDINRAKPFSPIELLFYLNW